MPSRVVRAPERVKPSPWAGRCKALKGRQAGRQAGCSVRLRCGIEWCSSRRSRGSRLGRARRSRSSLRSSARSVVRQWMAASAGSIQALHSRRRYGCPLPVSRLRSDRQTKLAGRNSCRGSRKARKSAGCTVSGPWRSVQTSCGRSQRGYSSQRHGVNAPPNDGTDLQNPRRP